MLKNKNIEKLFGNLDVTQNGNLLFIARIVIYEALHDNQGYKFDELLQLLGIKRPALLLIKDIDEFLQNKATIFDKEMRKKMEISISDFKKSPAKVELITAKIIAVSELSTRRVSMAPADTGII